MHAAVVTRLDRPPRYAEHPAPVASRPHEVIVDVVAAGLHPRVRSQADGSHYTSTPVSAAAPGRLPLVPGIDGVGRTADGVLHYFVLPDTHMGSLAEQTVVDLRRSVELPPDTDPVAVAAAANPVMSSWIALRHRAGLRPGQKVLVLGAGGNAGRLALEVAALLGAGEVVGAGRDTDLVEPGRDADVVLDYVWGPATAAALRAIVPARSDDRQRLTWVQIGSVGGLEAVIPSAALRATNLVLVGSGQGSVEASTIVSELPAIAAEISRGTFSVEVDAVPLADVERAWASPASGRRTVLVP